MIRILHIVTYMGLGGLETMLMNYYRHMPRDRIQFDFLVHREFNADYDKEILSLGGKIYHFQRLIPWSRRYRRQLTAFLDSHPEYRIHSCPSGLFQRRRLRVCQTMPDPCTHCP